MDEESLLARAAYVDLNPIPTALAETLEASDHPSVRRRIEAARAPADTASDEQGRIESTGDRQNTVAPARNASRTPDRFLAPLKLDEPLADEGEGKSQNSGPSSAHAVCDAAYKMLCPVVPHIARMPGSQHEGRMRFRSAGSDRRLLQSPSGGILPFFGGVPC